MILLELGGFGSGGRGSLQVMLRIVCIAIGVPALLVGAFGLLCAVVGDVAWLESARQALAGVAGDEVVARLTSLVPAGVASALGALLLFVGRRSGSEAVVAESREGMAPLDKRTVRKAARQAAGMAKRGHLTEAAEVCFESGLLDDAARYYEKAGEWVRVAEIRHDQNRLAESAELYARAGQHETAGTIYASQSDYARAADCYTKAGRMSVAAEMYEKAGNHARAGECYSACEFHRYAAQSYVRAQDWTRAAQALEALITEEGARARGHDPGQVKEFQQLVRKAGKLYEQAGDAVSALRVLERGECFGAAGRIAMRLEQFEKAADLFQRAGDAPRAAQALRSIGEEQAAAQVLGEHYREQGDDEEAARLLIQAGDYMAAGDIYRKLEDYKLAAECYERQGDSAQASEMFRLAGDYSRAAASYERTGRYEEAAECSARLGDHAQQASYLAKAEQWLRAGETYRSQGLTDEAIAALQQVPADDPEAPAAAALLGEIFQEKGKLKLAAQKLGEAIGEAPLGPDNIGLFYRLARVLEDAQQPDRAAEIYEKVLAADYGYEDAEQRLEAVRRASAAQPIHDALSGPQTSRPGRYQIVGELGRGGMGIVYKAQDTVLDRPVALKVLPDGLKDNPQALKNFLREAKSAAKLNHPNIVTVYDAGEQDGRYYIAMEYVDGTTLKEIVRRRGVISPTGVLHVLVQMCEALHYAHGQKVVHRDIKTANTMWTRDKKAKIMDFGLAKVVEEVRNHTTVVSGTPYYMSPEQTLGKNVDHRTDLYSLGVTLFELATGTLPFKEGNVPYHHVHTAPPDPRSVNPKLPAPLAAIISKCMQKDPAARYQTAGEIVREVRTLIGKGASASA